MQIHDHNGQPYEADLVAGEKYRELEREIAKLREALERRNKDARVLRKLHEDRLAPAINMELIQAEDAADVLLQD